MLSEDKAIMMTRNFKCTGKPVPLASEIAVHGGLHDMFH